MKVSILTPTTPDRAQFMERLAIIVNRQTHPIHEWLIDDGSGLIAEKRNRLIKRATGDIIVHMDSDDIYSPEYVEKAVSFLTSGQSRLIGQHNFPMHNVKTNDVHVFNNPGYIAEATFCHYREGFSLFPAVKTGEGEKILGQVRYSFHAPGTFMATVHGGNTCGHKTLPLIKKLPPEEAALILSKFYN